MSRDKRYQSKIQLVNVAWEKPPNQESEQSQKDMGRGLWVTTDTHVSPLSISAMLALEARNQTLMGMVAH